MAIKACRECKKEVSTEAKTCPHCGTPNPTTVKATVKETLSGLVVLVLLVAGTVTMCSDGDEEKAAAAKKLAEKDAACATDLQCIGDKLSMTMAYKCAPEVERLAKHSMRWTDGTLDAKFSRFRWADGDHKMVTLLGDRAEFQNGFGAHTNVVYQCDVDVSSSTVFAVRVTEGRL